MKQREGKPDRPDVFWFRMNTELLEALKRTLLHRLES